MGGDHGHGIPKIPDYRIYKVEDCPQLMTTKRMLAQHGLKDPWLRNEVWRYPPESVNGQWKQLNEIFFRKFKWGFVAAVLTIVGEKVYHHYYPEEDHHHH
ncbi:NADH dehydrogenase [ubiquinone] 1 beta subcomplex subunit 3-like [Uloborus diversus]|uniref:NADH dehydrogenase [ubiquinone] 1 beta subcomplex subunit 3-like n=1 Tax=Uloborus diversus TaxID=327109 RepID=UPI00240A657E|nr:NADH dehydrogenase [ubiquinone] 1 beta subcomplex subunit 3-like [Uloborus diversus]